MIKGADKEKYSKMKETLLTLYKTSTHNWFYLSPTHEKFIVQQILILICISSEFIVNLLNWQSLTYM